MRIISFNVNGLRARIKAGWPGKEFMEKYDPDIICLQEVRAKPDQILPAFCPALADIRLYISKQDTLALGLSPVMPYPRYCRSMLSQYLDTKRRAEYQSSTSSTSS